MQRPHQLSLDMARRDRVTVVLAGSPPHPHQGGRFPWEMTASVGIGKVGLSEKTSSDQYSCGRSMNN